MYSAKELDFLNNCKKTYKKDYEKYIIRKLDDTSKKTIIISLRLSDYLSSNWKLFKDIKSNKKNIIINNYQKFIDLFPNNKIILITY